MTVVLIPVALEDMPYVTKALRDQASVATVLGEYARNRVLSNLHNKILGRLKKMGSEQAA